MYVLIFISILGMYILIGCVIKNWRDLCCRERRTWKCSVGEPGDKETSSALSLPRTQLSLLDRNLLGGRDHFFSFDFSGSVKNIVYSEEPINCFSLGRV